MKEPPPARPGTPFLVEVAAVLLLAFLVLEAASIPGLSPSVVSVLPDPVDRGLVPVLLILGLFGVYGLWRDEGFGVYPALLTTVFEVVLGGYALVKAYIGAQWTLGLVASSLTVSVLGLLTLLCIFGGVSDQGLVEMVSGVSPPRPRDSPDAGGEYAIEVIDVRKEYRLGPNVVVALNGLNLRIRKGEFVAIMGPSGSGKSTLLNLIGALDRPTSGRVLIDGVDISTLDEDSLARLRNEKVGFVFQAYNLIARSTVMRNMELPALVKGYPKEERLRRIRGLLNVVGLGDKLLRRPKTLSGGEQQRVAIARALINDPSIVLADEPTGNVDSKTGRVIMGFFRKLNQERGTTIVVVTHDPEVARMTDRILYLRDGRIVGEETVGRSPG